MTADETRDVEALAEFLRELLNEHDRHHAISNAPYGYVCGNECRARTISTWLAEHDAEVEARVRERLAQVIVEMASAGVSGDGRFDGPYLQALADARRVVREGRIR